MVRQSFRRRIRLAILSVSSLRRQKRGGTVPCNRNIINQLAFPDFVSTQSNSLQLVATTSDAYTTKTRASQQSKVYKVCCHCRGIPHHRSRTPLRYKFDNIAQSMQRIFNLPVHTFHSTPHSCTTQVVTSVQGCRKDFLVDGNGVQHLRNPASSLISVVTACASTFSYVM